MFFQGTITGYRSVLRTFFSAFIASYEITLQVTLFLHLCSWRLEDLVNALLSYSAFFMVQPEDGNLKLILDILCKIYRGEV